MFNHIMVGANNLEASKQFYDAILGSLGIAPGEFDSDVRCSFRTPTGVFMIKIPINGEAASHGNGSTVGFVAASSAQVDAWHAAGNCQWR